MPARFAQGSDPSVGVSVSDDDRFDGIGAHLFGLESPIVLDLLKKALEGCRWRDRARTRT